SATMYRFPSSWERTGSGFVGRDSLPSDAPRRQAEADPPGAHNRSVETALILAPFDMTSMYVYNHNRFNPDRWPGRGCRGGERARVSGTATSEGRRPPARGKL